MPNIIRDLSAYKRSTDYHVLWRLAQTNSFVCVVDYTDQSGDEPLRDVAQTIYGGGVLTVAARGISWVTAFAGPEQEADFVRQCESVNLEWLVP